MPEEEGADPSWKVAVLEPGTGPRQPRRYDVGVGHEESIVLELDRSLTLEVGDMRPPHAPRAVAGPTQQFTVAARVEDKAEDNRLTVSLRIDKAEILDVPDTSSDLAAALTADLAALEGLKGRLVVTSRGQVESMNFKGGQDLSQQARASLAHLRRALATAVVALPDEPVGRGARWRGTGKVRAEVLVLDESMDVTLARAAPGTRASLAIAQTGSPQRLRVATLPRGTRGEIETISGEGTGEAVLTEGRLFAPLQLVVETRVSGSISPPRSDARPMRMHVVRRLVVR
jgi:hypothetical protein